MHDRGRNIRNSEDCYRQRTFKINKIRVRGEYFLFSSIIKLNFIVHLQSKTERGYLYIMIIINVKDGESLDKALKRFKKKFEKTGVLREIAAVRPTRKFDYPPYPS